MQVLSRSARALFSVLLLVSLSACSEPMPEGCIPVGNPERTDGISKVEIRNPGHYCLTESLHARIEIADRPAEGTIIAIHVGDVVLDLRGHTLGRGWLFKNRGGHGIQIYDPYSYDKRPGPTRNITIRNGILQDFERGIYFDYSPWWRSVLETPTYDPATNTYHFPENNITLENITFKNNKTDFEIYRPNTPKK